MKILTYSDIHLEFGGNWELPADVNGDVIILAGDILSFENFLPLEHFLRNWSKPILFVSGNHEYYKCRMKQAEKAFETWAADTVPQLHFLKNEAIEINGVHFFGGTMWTNFNNENPLAMQIARRGMSDFRLIYKDDGSHFMPEDTLLLHRDYTEKLLSWLEATLSGPRIVISHHAPVVNPNTQYVNTPLMPAFNSLDMIEIIERHQPDLWVYGHTHECDDQRIGKTRIISNQLGYPHRTGFECAGFDPAGKPVDL